MYFLVNASPPRQLDVAFSNFADAWLAQKRVFAMVFHRLKSSCFCFLFCELKLFHDSSYFRRQTPRGAGGGGGGGGI